MNERSQWGTRLGFLLAAMGSAIGLGNIWRFPQSLMKMVGEHFYSVLICFINCRYTASHHGIYNRA